MSLHTQRYLRLIAAIALLVGCSLAWGVTLFRDVDLNWFVHAMTVFLISVLVTGLLIICSWAPEWMRS